MSHHHEHHHQHHHHHQHGVADSIEANTAFFNEHAKNVDNEWSEQIAQVCRLYKSNVDFKDKDVLDFACGTGSLVLTAATEAKSVIGVDISEGMLKQAQDKIKDASFNTSHVRTIQIKELKEAVRSGGVLDGVKVDLITCSLSYHHFDNPTEITSLLATLLKPSGQLTFIDFMFEDTPAGRGEKFEHENMPPEGVVPHTLGFKQEQIKEFIEGTAEKTGLKFESWTALEPFSLAKTNQKFMIALAKSTKL